MRVEMLRLMCNPKYGNRQPGDQLDMDDADATKRIANGDCKSLEEKGAQARGRKSKDASAPAVVEIEPGQGAQDKPVEKMTLDQLTAYATAHKIDLGEATLKADVLRVVVAAVEAARDADNDD